MKKIITKFYKPDGSWITDLNTAIFDGFSKELNAGLGECILRIAERFDYSGAEITLGNLVKIFISDKETITFPDGYILVYSGFISLIEPNTEAGNDEILVHCLGNYTKLAVDFLKNATQTTLYTEATAGLTITFADAEAADVGLIMRTIIARYRAETTNPQINCTILTIPDTATTVFYAFEQKTYTDAINKMISAAPLGYFWYVDEYGMIYLKAKPTTPTHIFDLKKTQKSLKISLSMENIRNVFLIWNGESVGASCVYKHYEDSKSISQYGRRAEALMDTGIQDEASADLIGAKLKDELKDPQLKISFEVLDNNEDAVNGYDIESIQPGDTCSILGFDNASANLIEENMLITRVNYTPSKAVVYAELRRVGFIELQADLNREVEDLSSNGTPEVYT